MYSNRLYESNIASHFGRAHLPKLWHDTPSDCVFIRISYSCWIEDRVQSTTTSYAAASTGAGDRGKSASYLMSLRSAKRAITIVRACTAAPLLSLKS